MRTPFTVSADMDLGDRIAPFMTASGDVTIRSGEVPASLEAPDAEGISYQVDAENFLLKVPNGVRFLVRGGEEIIYEREDGVTDREVGLFLLGSAWGALCYQRDLLPLHASGIIAGGDVHAFTGPSGAGKSTLAAALSDRGFDFFTDDILIIDVKAAGDETFCYSGQKDLKLWRDALELTSAKKGLPVRERKPLAKFFATPRQTALASAGHLKNLSILATSKERSRNGECCLTSLQGGLSIAQLADSVYRPNFAQAIWGRKKLYTALDRVIQSVAVNKFHRPMVKSEFDRGLDYISDWLAAQIETTTDQSKPVNGWE